MPPTQLNSSMPHPDSTSRSNPIPFPFSPPVGSPDDSCVFSGRGPASRPPQSTLIHASISGCMVESTMTARGVHIPSDRTAIALMAVFFSLGGCLILGLICYFWRGWRRRRAEFRELRRQMELASRNYESSTRCPGGRVAEETREDTSREEAPSLSQPMDEEAGQGRPILQDPEEGQVRNLASTSGNQRQNTPPVAPTLPWAMRRAILHQMRARGMSVEELHRQMSQFGMQIPISELRRMLGEPATERPSERRRVTEPPPQLPPLQELTGSSEPPGSFQSFPVTAHQSSLAQTVHELELGLSEAAMLRCSTSDMQFKNASDDPRPGSPQPRSSTAPPGPSKDRESTNEPRPPTPPTVKANEPSSAPEPVRESGGDAGPLSGSGDECPLNEKLEENIVVESRDSDSIPSVD